MSSVLTSDSSDSTTSISTTSTPVGRVIELPDRRKGVTAASNQFLLTHRDYDMTTFNRHQLSIEAYFQNYIARPHTATELTVDGNAVVGNPSLVYKIATQTGFSVAPSYTGPVESEVASKRYPGRKVPVLSCAGGVNIPRFPTSDGSGDTSRFFVGSMMPVGNRLVLPGLLRETPLPEEERNTQYNYLIALGSDAGIHRDLVVKWGCTADWETRRKCHASTHGEPTSVMLRIQIPDEYDRFAVERAMHALMAQWRHHGKEYFCPPVCFLHDLMQCRDFTQLMTLMVVYSSNRGQLFLNTLNQHVVEGRVTHVQEHRAIEVVQPGQLNTAA